MANFTHKQPASSRLGEVSIVNDDDKKVLLQFTHHYGFEYFDTQQSAEHDITPLVKGVTFGASQADSAYVFGAYEDYDVTCVQRLQFGKSIWITMAFSLHTAVYLPHVLIGAQADLQRLVAELGLNDLRLRGFSASGTSNQVSQHFAVYAPSTLNSTIEHIISPELANALVEQIPHVIVEVSEDTVYVSVSDQDVSEELLTIMLRHGVQFASYIDKQMGAA